MTPNLFMVFDVESISLHVRNVLSEGELAAAATVKDHLTVRTEGKREVRRKVQLYNLDMILAVGYRVKSPRGTQFRQWATTHLREYLVKGFVMDDERLKNPPVGDKAARDHPGRTAGASPADGCEAVGPAAGGCIGARENHS